MENKSLIELFENKAFQDVGTFNSIFTQTPILGFSADTEVEIKELTAGGTRRIVIAGQDVFMDIKQATPKTNNRIKTKIKPLKKVNNLEKRTLPEVFKILKPTEFLVYQAIKFLGSVDSIEQLSKQISINRKTISLNIKKLKKMNLIVTEKVSSNGQPLLRLHLTH